MPITPPPHSRLRRGLSPKGETKTALALFLLLAPPAFPHPLAPALLEIRAGGESESTMLLRTSPSIALGALTPRLPERCTTSAAGEPVLANGAIERRARIGCVLGAGDAIAIDGLDEAGGDAVLRVVDRDGGVVQALLTPRAPRFALPERPSSFAVAVDYLRLGVEHLATGLDHLLFVAGLFALVARRRLLFATLLAFTLGHSVTLALAVLGFVRAPTTLVEVGIAASLLFLAAELAEAPRRASGFGRRPLAMAAGFGLLHGFGFAGALAETGLPAGEIPLALVAFNLGIELAQIAEVLLLAAVTLAASRVGWRVPRLAPAYAIGGLAGYWLLERAKNTYEVFF